MKGFDQLLSPIRIGNVTLKNRVVMAAMETHLGDFGILGNLIPYVSEQMTRWFVERARGGTGLIITGMLNPLPYSIDKPPYHPGMCGDCYSPGLRHLVESVHAEGAPVFVQVQPSMFAPLRPGGPIRIHTRGREFDTKTPLDVIGPSEWQTGKTKVRGLSIDEIKDIVELHGVAAQRGRELGFDGLCMTFGIASLPNLFMSPLSNKRTDAYGGNPENRMRFPLEVLESVRKHCGKDWPVIVRLGVSDFMDGGLVLDDMKVYAPMLEKAGVAALSLIGGWHASSVPIFQHSVPPGILVDMGAQIKQTVRIPVSISHRLNNPVLAEQILAGGKADLIELGRALVADPEFVNKARSGNPDTVRKCIACCRCFDTIGLGFPIRCTVNPRAGREAECDLKPAPKPKKVLVIGGGIAGLEAARVAATRGHRVTLMEKQDKLGGQLLVAAIPPYKEELKELVQHLVWQAREAGVDLQLGKEATASSIAEQKPDVIIVATGAKPLVPAIPGASGPNVATAIDVLTGARKTGESVIVVGGGSLGCEMAEFLLAQKKKVTIVEMLPRLGNDITPAYRWVIIQRLRKGGVNSQVGSPVVEINQKGIVVAQPDGQRRAIEGDTVVLAIGMQPVRDLYARLAKESKEVYLVGDSLSAGRIGEAIWSAFELARRI